MCCSIAKFFTFFVSFAYFYCTKPKMFQKNIQKYVFGVKFPALSNAAGRIALNIEKSRKIEKKLYFPLFLKIPKAKTPFSI